MWRVLGNTLLNHGQRVKLKGEKADVCDVVPSTAAQCDSRQYVLKLMNLFIVYCSFHSLLGFCVRSLFCCAGLCVLSSFTMISLGKRELVALLVLSSWCHVAVIGICPFFNVSWVGLQRVIVAFPGHSHLLSDRITTRYLSLRIVSLALAIFH